METQNAPIRGRLLPTCYDDFMDPSVAPLDLAASITGTYALLSRNIWRKRLNIIGEQVFRKTLFLFWSDLRAGESVRSRARAFTARLNAAVRDIGESSPKGGRP